MVLFRLMKKQAKHVLSFFLFEIMTVVPMASKASPIVFWLLRIQGKNKLLP